MIVILLLGVVNVVLVVMLSGLVYFGLYGIILVGVVFFILKNVIFMLFYVFCIIGYKKYVFFKGIIGFFLVVVFVWVVCEVIWFVVKIDGWILLIVVGMIVSCCYVVFVFMFVCMKEER